MYHSIEPIGLSPATRSNPVMSGSHCTREANGHDSPDNSLSLPSSTEKPTTLLRPPIVATLAAMVFPSGDHDGPAKNIGVSCCGAFLTTRLRSPLPSTFAITSALSFGFG